MADRIAYKGVLPTVTHHQIEASMKLLSLTPITAFTLIVAAGDFKFSYPRQGTELSHTRKFGVFWSGTFPPPGSTEEYSYRLSFVRINTGGGLQPNEQYTEIVLDNVSIEGKSRHYSGDLLPPAGSYQIWARGISESFDSETPVPDGQKTATFRVID